MALIHLEPLPRRASKGEILAMLESTGGLNRQRVGRIELQGRRAAVEVPDGWETRLAKLLDGQSLGDRRVRCWVAGEPPAHAGQADHFQRLTQLLEMESRAEGSGRPSRCGGSRPTRPNRAVIRCWVWW